MLYFDSLKIKYCFDVGKVLEWYKFLKCSD